MNVDFIFAAGRSMAPRTIFVRPGLSLPQSDRRQPRRGVIQSHKNREASVTVSAGKQWKWDSLTTGDGRVANRRPRNFTTAHDRRPLG
jgi:hypothetical protein